MAIPGNQLSRRRCFVHDNGNCFGMHASEGLFGYLPSRTADVTSEKGKPTDGPDGQPLDADCSPWRAVRRIHMLRLAGVVPITMRWPFECCTTVRRKIERRHSGRSWRSASISTECIRGMVSIKGDRCDRHCVASQAFRDSENFLLWRQKVPPMAGFSNC
jgi:hypothetical protein